jgi:hypothetical protein
MNVFSFLKKKNDFSSFAMDKKTFAKVSLAQFTLVFREYSDFEDPHNSMVWDSVLPIALIGYNAYIEKIERDKIKKTELIKEVAKQFPKGSDLLLADYFDYINKQDNQIDKLSILTSFWLSKNLQLYVRPSLKYKVMERKIMNIFSMYFLSSYNETQFNYQNYISENFNGNLKTTKGMIEFITLTEIFAKNTFEIIKTKIE